MAEKTEIFLLNLDRRGSQEKLRLCCKKGLREMKEVYSSTWPQSTKLQTTEHRLVILLSRSANNSHAKKLGYVSRTLRLAQQQALSQLVGNTSRCQHHARKNQPLINKMARE